MYTARFYPTKYLAYSARLLYSKNQHTDALFSFKELAIRRARVVRSTDSHSPARFCRTIGRYSRHALGIRYFCINNTLLIDKPLPIYRHALHGQTFFQPQARLYTTHGVSCNGALNTIEICSLRHAFHFQDLFPSTRFSFPIHTTLRLAFMCRFLSSCGTLKYNKLILSLTARSRITDSPWLVRLALRQRKIGIHGTLLLHGISEVKARLGYTDACCSKARLDQTDTSCSTARLNRTNTCCPTARFCHPTIYRPSTR